LDALPRNRALEILRVLKDNLSVSRPAEYYDDPFRTLILMVISQNTNDENTFKAFHRLSDRFPITLRALAEADVGEIEEAIRVAGLHRNKSKAIKKLSQIVLKRFGGLSFIHTLSLEEARKRLVALPQVGPKTADAILLFCAKKPVLPVDTHVGRVAKRLGLAAQKAGYEEVRRALEALYRSQDYLSVHWLFIAHGRKYCKATRPLCKPCPINYLCPSKNNVSKR